MIGSNRAFICGLSACGFALLATFALPAQSQPIGSVVALAPDAYGTPPTEEPSLLAIGRGVVTDELIQTLEAANVRIRFLDDTDLRVGASSMIVLDSLVYDPNQGVTEIVLGIAVGVARIVSGDIAPGGLLVQTPVALIGVRGTDFVVAVEASGRTTVAVIEGSVVVTPTGRPPVIVYAGETIVIEPDEDTPAVIQAGLVIPDDPGLDLPPAATIEPVDAGPDLLQAFEVEVLQVIPQTGTNPFDPDLDPEQSDSGSTVSVVNNIPISRLTLAGPDSCSSNHFHGNANNCSGVFTVDPAPLVCGHGEVENVSVISVSECPDL